MSPYVECRHCGCWHYTRGKRKCSSPHGHDFTPPDPFACCGGNDERRPHHCSDCPKHPWVSEPDPRCVEFSGVCPHSEDP
ncbi:MAG: hypothetical protein IPQ09_31030 [Myxococcales bacterium]|nr:hypothetical protein [Myxococcales bacterium]